MTQATGSLRAAACARAALVAGIVLALDQITKRTIASGIALGAEKKLLPGVHLVHVRNTGVAFSLFSGGGTLVLVLTLAALAILIGYFLRRPDRPWLWLPTGMLIGGAIGNLADRLRFGAVVDFVYVHVGAFDWFPAFNCADSSITVGAALLAIDSLFGGRD